MKIGEYAGDYIKKYEGTEVNVIDLAWFDDGDILVFDLSDGTHWLSDVNDIYQVAESLCMVDDIGYDEHKGYFVANMKPIEYVED